MVASLPHQTIMQFNIIKQHIHAAMNKGYHVLNNIVTANNSLRFTLDALTEKGAVAISSFCFQGQ